MAKLTQFGRMRRRIKRELDAARTERALGWARTAALLASGAAAINVVRSAVVLKKLKEYPDGSELVSSQRVDGMTKVSGEVTINDIKWGPGVITLQEALGREARIDAAVEGFKKV